MDSKDRAATLVVGAIAGAVALSLYNKTARSAATSSAASLNSAGAPAAAARKVDSVSSSDDEDDDIVRGVLLRPYEHDKRMRARIRQAAGSSKDDGESGGRHGKEYPVDDDDAQRLQRTYSIREEVVREAAMERNRVVVRVPATSANMGPGFDCLGMALSIWSEVTMERSDKFEIVFEGAGFEEVPLDETNLLVTGAKAAFKAAGKAMPPLKYKCVNRIPYARGMGSSSAAILAGLIGGLVLAGHKLPMWGAEELLQLACEIEGHPDNVAPVIYGGCQLGIHNHTRWITERVQLPPGIQVVLFIPNFIGKTSDARAVLKDQVDRKDAIFSIGRIAWLVLALQSGNVNNLRAGCEDKMHQPQRARQDAYKHVNPMIEAAIAAGADAAYLSGSGPTVAAITSGAAGDIFLQRTKERVDKQVAEAMLQAAASVNVGGETFITTPTDGGAYVVSAEPKFSEGAIRYPGDV
ncbi:unnamed protein product [Ectocarpus sp. CCAP 1310/34]|nr:unnamed protein product [Ectocarpus sp. CCAP 1310/34]